MSKKTFFSNLYKNSKKRLFAVTAIVAIATGILTGLVVEKTTPAKASDCSANAIIQCGISSTGQLRDKYNQNAHGDLKDILHHYGINGDNIGEMVMGTSHKNGNITVNGEVVATEARSIGRQHLSNAWEKNISGSTYYEKYSTDVFLSNQLPTFVLLEDGRFVSGVILDCGNLITGNPTKPEPKPEPKPGPKPEHKPKPKPEVSIEKTINGKDHLTTDVNKSFTYEITVNNDGKVDLEDVDVTDEAPEGVTLLKADKGEISGNSWSYTIPSLKIGESKTFILTAVVKEYIEGRLENTACVDASEVPGNPDDCDDATVEVKKPNEIVVCVLETKNYPVTILEKDFDETLHSTNPKDCQDEPAPPVELPKTGLTQDILKTLGAGGISTAIVAYILSRRGLII